MVGSINGGGGSNIQAYQSMFAKADTPGRNGDRPDGQVSREELSNVINAPGVSQEEKSAAQDVLQNYDAVSASGGAGNDKSSSQGLTMEQVSDYQAQMNKSKVMSGGQSGGQAGGNDGESGGGN